jgi:hypothetical protein
MKAEDKYALIAGAFLPWILIWIFSYAVDGPDSIRQSIQLFSPVWAIISPLVTLFLLKLTVIVMRR